MCQTSYRTFGLLAPILALPSLYPLSQQSILLILAVLSTTTVGLFAILHDTRLRPWLSTPWPTSLILTGLALLTPFTHHSVSIPMSAWSTLLSPLTATGLLPLLTPLMLVFTIFTLRSTHHKWDEVNRLTLCLFLCLIMWSPHAADFPALGLLFLNLTILLTRQRISSLELTAAILLLAAASTAHPLYLYIPALLGFALFAVWPKRALAVTAGSYALIAAFNPTAPSIPSINLTDPTTLAAAALLLIVLIQSLYHWRWWPAHQHAAWGLGIPALVLALGNLTETTSLADWEGAIFLTTALPVITYTLLRPTFKHR